jgi:hypothetical protein
LLRIGEVHIVWGVAGAVTGLMIGRSARHWREQMRRSRSRPARR